MKSLFLLPLLLYAVSQCFLTAAIHLGDDLEKVIDELGKPIGTVSLRDKTLLLYPQGEVSLKEDVVTEIDLMSEEEFQAEQERLERERVEWLAQKERRAQAHKEEGESIRAAKITSASFTALPAKDRVDYWRRFQINYPNVDVTEELAKALESYQTELTELKAQQRIAELEARVAQAEQEAAAARLETERLRKEAEEMRQSTRYGLRYYYDPVVRPRYLYRPPTITIFSNDNNNQTQHSVPKYWNYPKYNPNGTAERVTHILQEHKIK